MAEDTHQTKFVELTVYHIDHETLDVRSVMILISHDYQMSISKLFDIIFVVLLIHVEAHNFLQKQISEVRKMSEQSWYATEWKLNANTYENILDLGVLHHLCMSSITNIQRLSLQRENPVVVTTDNRDARHGQRFCRISLGDNECAVL